jgi:transposase
MLSEGNAPKNEETTCFLHDNAPAHRSVLVKDFSAKNNVETLELPLYCPDRFELNFVFSSALISTEMTAILWCY